MEEKRKHNETKDQLTEAKNKKDMFDFEYTEEYLPELVYLKENIESLKAAKGGVTQQLDTFQEDHLNVSQELSEVKKLAKDGNLIRYENKYDGQHYDKNRLFSFTDAILAKFREGRCDDDPAPHPFPFNSRNPGTAAEMVDIIRKERQYIEDIGTTPALYISFMNYAIRKFEKPYIYEKFMLFVKEYAFSRPRYENAKCFYKSQQTAAEATQQTGAAVAEVVLPAAVPQPTSTLILPSPTLKPPPKNAIKPRKRKQLPLPSTHTFESKIIKLWDALTGIEKEFATVLGYTEDTWNSCAFVFTHALPWDKLRKNQQEAADHLFGRVKWEKNVNTKDKKKSKKLRKKREYFQRSPVPEVEVSTTRSAEPNKILITDNGEHFFIHRVIDDSSSTGVLLPHNDTKEEKLVYNCPYCTRNGINPSGFTQHITNCPYNPHRLK